MAIDIKNYIIEKVRILDPTIDTRPGSVFRDFFINPLVPIIEQYEAEHNAVLNTYNVTDLSILEESQLDATAANFLLERITGSKATGYVKMYFSAPRSINLGQGTVLTSASGRQFEVVSDFSVTKLQMELNTGDYPNYDSGLIPVIAKIAGSEYQEEPNTTFTLASSAITPIKIVNTAVFIGGTDKETNTAFYARIKNEIANLSLASSAAIETQIKNLVTTAIAVEVVGAGHFRMIRDLTTSIANVTSFSSEDYFLVHSGMHSGYDKPHVAYTGAFQDINETEAIDFPTPASWSREFSNDFYTGIYKLTDALYAEGSTYVLVNELFGDADPINQQPSLNMLAASGLWEFHDGISPSQDPYYLDEFGIDIANQRLRLGKTLDNTDLTNNSDVALALSELQSIYTQFSNALTLTDFNIAAENYTTLVDAINFNSVSPIFSKEIDQHTGIEISCTMETTDATENGEMAYITVLRNSKIFKPQDGYGLAWRKQPEFLIRLHTNLINASYTYPGGTTQYTTDAARFEEEFQTSLLSTWAVSAGGTGIPNTYWKYNVFLVDNDILQEEVWIGSDQLWDQTNGMNQFLQAAKVWIEPNIRYGFKLKVYAKLGFEGWVWDDESDVYNVDTHKVIDRGTTYPPYIPTSGELQTTETGIGTIVSTRGHFGISVAQTMNYEWYVDTLIVKSFEETFPMHLFKFKLPSADFNSANQCEINYYGAGYDAVQYGIDSNTGHSKVEARVYNVVDAVWETLGTHTYTPAQVEVSKTLGKLTKTLNPLSNYLDSDGYTNIAAAAVNTGTSFPNDTEHTLRSYYVEANNIVAEAFHRGNAMDIYVHDPSNIVEGSVVATMSENSLHLQSLTGTHNYIQEIIEVREFISQVAFDTSSYSIVNNNTGTTYSKNSSYTINFSLEGMAGTILEVVYRYWAKGDTVDAYFTSADRVYPVADQSIKVMPPTIIDITKLEYSGGLAETEMKLKIRDYFNELTSTTFDKSDLVNVLYTNGATFVNLNMTIDAQEYDPLMAKVTTRVEQTFTISSLNVGRFYTNLTYLSGVSQI